MRQFRGRPSRAAVRSTEEVIIEDQREFGAKIFENLQVLRFASHWGFRIRACRPYRARTKGKVERPVGHLREGFFYGREFLNDEDLNDQLAFWIAHKANLRIHGTTHELPQVRFERDERGTLLALAPRSYRSIIPATPVTSPRRASVPTVERRSLVVYSRIAGVRR